MERIDWKNLNYLREKFGLTPISFGDTSETIGDTSETIRGIAGDRELTFAMLRSREAIYTLSAIQSGLSATSGRTPSRSVVCAQFVFDGLVTPTYTRAFDSLRTGDSYTFSGLFDFAYGGGTIVGKVMLANKLKETNIEQLTQRLSEDSQAIEIQKGLLIMDSQIVAGLFEQDETGFLLVDEYLAILKGERPSINVPRSIWPFHLPEFVIEGAKVAVESYKILYHQEEV